MQPTLLSDDQHHVHVLRAVLRAFTQQLWNASWPQYVAAGPHSSKLHSAATVPHKACAQDMFVSTLAQTLLFRLPHCRKPALPVGLKECWVQCIPRQATSPPPVAIPALRRWQQTGLGLQDLITAGRELMAGADETLAQRADGFGAGAGVSTGAGAAHPAATAAADASGDSEEHNSRHVMCCDAAPDTC
jgi:hypothetical protein